MRTFKKRFSELHVLVNNGGFAPQEGAVTKEGYESGLGAMHFGHFLLTVRGAWHGCAPTWLRLTAGLAASHANSTNWSQ